MKKWNVVRLIIITSIFFLVPTMAMAAIVLDANFTDWTTSPAIVDSAATNGGNPTTDILTMSWNIDVSNQYFYWMMDRVTSANKVRYYIILDIGNNGFYTDTVDRIVEVKYKPEVTKGEVEVKVFNAATNVKISKVKGNWGDTIAAGGSRAEWGVSFADLGIVNTNQTVRMYAGAVINEIEVEPGLTSNFQNLTDLIPDSGAITWPILGVTLAVVSDFNAYTSNNQVVIEWKTVSEINTVGFDLYRQNSTYQKINAELLPALLNSPQGGTYQYIDKTAHPGQTYSYKLVEIEVDGNKIDHGPFTVAAEIKLPGNIVADYSRVANQSSFAPPTKDTLSAKLSVADKKSQGEVNAIKIVVTENGMHYQAVDGIAEAMGIPAEDVKQLFSKNQFRLNNQGERVDFYFMPADNTGGIYFYGKALDSPYSSENIYWLTRKRDKKDKKDDIDANSLVKGSTFQVYLPIVTSNGNSSTSEQFMLTLGEDGPKPATEQQAFTEFIHAEEDNWPLPGINSTNDYWFWNYIFSGFPGMGNRIFTIRTDGATPNSRAELTVHLQGATNTKVNPDHHAVIKLNGTQIGEGYWDGASAYNITVPIGTNLLNDGDNRVEIIGLRDTGAIYSLFYVDSFDLSYQREYKAVNNALQLPGTGQVITVEGFTNQRILLFDITKPNKPRIIEKTTRDWNNGSYRVSFKGKKTSTYLAMTLDGGLKYPSQLIADSPSTLKNEDNRAEYLVIAPSEFKATAQLLADLRQEQGLSTMVVDVVDIYDEFNNGLSSPEAIKDFLSYAYHNWETPPRYVLLAGEGTFDYKNNMGYGDNLIPPMMMLTPFGFIASDNYFVDVSGNDNLPEMAIGRLPVATVSELLTYIDKIRAYEGADNSNGWQNQILMLADNADKAGNFPADSDNVANLISADYRTEKIYLSEHTASEARQLVINGINRGAALVNYIGHGGMDRLSNEGILQLNDINSLNNGGRLPIITAMTCVINNYATPGYDFMGEKLVLKNNGGAVAVWAATSLSYNPYAIILDEAFFRAAFDGEKLRLGDAMLNAMNDYTDRGGRADMLNVYTLLGDPAIRMK